MPKTSKGTLFEERVYNALKIEDGWINLTPYEIKINATPGGQQYVHKQFSSQFKIIFSHSVYEVLSKAINPDFVFYNPILNKAIIVEAKCQTEKGSVDEKLQTAPYKIRQLTKVFSLINCTDVSYYYALHKEDFSKEEYRDTFEYLDEIKNCGYYFVDNNFSLIIK